MLSIVVVLLLSKADGIVMSVTVKNSNSFTISDLRPIDVKNLTKEEVLRVTKDDLACFTTDETQLILLGHIERRAMKLLGSKDPQYKRIQNALYFKSRRDELAANRRRRYEENALAQGNVCVPRGPRKLKPVNDPDAFDVDYEEEKYIQHHVEPRVYNQQTLSIDGGRVIK